MPEWKRRLEVERSLSASEYECLSYGWIPQHSEEEWFIYLSDDWLYVHRNWTGFCIFQAAWEAVGNQYRLREVWLNQDPSQYTSRNDRYEANLFNFLIDMTIQLNTDSP